jgi:hypothetical protein
MGCYSVGYPWPGRHRKASDTYRDQSLQFGVARTGYEVVIDHAGRLHQGVANRRTDEFEPAPQ